jgi:hypothetical protein
VSITLLSAVATVALIGLTPVLALSEIGRQPGNWVALGCALITSGFTWATTRNRSRLATVEKGLKDCNDGKAKCAEELEATKRELLTAGAADRAALEARIAALEAKVNS